MLNLPTNVDQSEIVQLPAVIVDGKVMIASPELKNMPSELLKNMAIAMRGEVGYIKVRAVYEDVDTQFCTAYECWRPAEPNTHRCDSHEQ